MEGKEGRDMDICIGEITLELIQIARGGRIKVCQLTMWLPMLSRRDAGKIRKGGILVRFRRSVATIPILSLPSGCLGGCLGRGISFPWAIARLGR